MEKQMYRSRRSRMIGGVAGGFAEYFDIDPVIVRALFILLFFAWGASLFAYIVLWIIVPDERRLWEKNNSPMPNAPERETTAHVMDIKRSTKRRSIIAFLLIGTGGLLLIHKFVFWLDAEIVIPVVLILIGSYILYRSVFKPNNSEA